MNETEILESKKDKEVGRKRERMRMRHCKRKIEQDSKEREKD
jgi:hypothetical protein